MLDKLEAFIRKGNLFTRDNKLLLAFSGGVDSVVLAQLLKAGGYHFELAHCNFKLRGKESDADEQFCKDFAKKNKLKVSTKQFDTKKFVKETGRSVQMAARELRYNWFNELAKEKGYDCIITAHHANDVIETLLINLVRGTGINGLKGIPVKQNLMVRPFLFATKESILEYAKKNKLKYRNDSSNDEIKYKRNYLRHEIIPGLKKLNPSLESTFENNVRLFRQTAKVVEQFVTEKEKQIIEVNKSGFNISIPKLVKEESAELLLFEWLSPKGFNAGQTEQIFKSLASKQSGKLFFSDDFKALIDRDKIIIETIETKVPEKEFLINNIQDLKKLPFSLEAEISTSKKIISGKAIAQIDMEKSVFPLKIRKWKAGDKFMPLGMTGFKKISDFLVNQKMNRFEKENIWLLLNKNEVVWVIGQRLDERYKIGPRSKKILKLELR